jgi:hypothetical protein
MRTEKLRRFVDVQRQLQRAAEWRLHDLRQEEHRLQQAQEDVFAVLNRGDELSIGLAPALTRKLARLASDVETAADAGARQVYIVLQQASRLKHAERIERTLASEEDRAREKMVLGDILDVIVGGRNHPGGAIVR